MTRAEALDRGRKALQQRAWADAFAQLSVADRSLALEPPDLVTVNGVGRDAERIAKAVASRSRAKRAA